MASLSVAKTGKRKGERRVYFNRPMDGKRVTLYLGKRIPMKAAETVRVRVEDLVHSSLANTSPSQETSSWLGGIGADLRLSLERHGLVSPSLQSTRWSVSQLVDKYIASQPVAKATLAVYQQATSHFVGFFGHDHPVAAITPSDLDQWRKSLHTGGLAPATAAKRVNVIKALFNKATEWNVIQKNPARSLKRGSQANPQRNEYVPLPLVEQVINACPDPVAKAIIGLARYAGLRTPSELVKLQVGHVDLAKRRMVVYSKKTHRSRIVPISPALATLLQPLMGGSATDLLFPRTQSTSNYRTMLHRAIKSIGAKPWPKTFQNLRASCAQDINEMVPAHAAAKIMGHSITVASNHYVSVTDDHFRKITHPDEPVTEGATRKATQQASVVDGTPQNRIPQVEEDAELVLVAASGEGWGMGGEGFEPIEKTSGKLRDTQSCNAECNVDEVLLAQLRAVIMHWGELEPNVKSGIAKALGLGAKVEPRTGNSGNGTGSHHGSQCHQSPTDL
jgi:integrase